MGLGGFKHGGGTRHHKHHVGKGYHHGKPPSSSSSGYLLGGLQQTESGTFGPLFFLFSYSSYCVLAKIPALLEACDFEDFRVF